MTWPTLRRAPAGRTTRLVIGVVLVLTACLLSACSRQVTGPSLVLRLASPDDPSDETTYQQVRHFADEVFRRSQGTVRIDPVLDVDAGALSWDQLVAHGVATGTWDLGLVPGRAWDELGVSSLRALNTPFLVTSPAALETLLDNDIRSDLLSGLPRAGVVGLDILPDGMRHPFGYTAPLLGAADYQGATIRSARSATVAMLLSALGATVTDAVPNSGVQRGAESQFSTTPAGIATGNVTFFAKTDVLVAGSAVRNRLRPDQWTLLRDAAAATRVWMFAQQPSDFEAAAAFCENGGQIVAASPQQVASVRAAGAQVTQKLRQDPGTRRLIDRITALIAGLPAPDPILQCPGRPPAPPDATVAEADQLDGVYTATVPAKILRDAGTTDEQAIQQNSGQFTWILHGGTWIYHQQSDQFVARIDDTGRYTFNDGVFTLYWSSDAGNWSRATTHVGRDGTISFTDIHDGTPGGQPLAEGFFSIPWTRIGNSPT